jgi:hypothetical protein
MKAQARCKLLFKEIGEMWLYLTGQCQFPESWVPLWTLPLWNPGKDGWIWFGMCFRVPGCLVGDTLFMAWRRQLARLLASIMRMW